MNTQKLYLILAILLSAVLAAADVPSPTFAEQMNQIKRSGEYVYAECIGANRTDAVTDCNEMLKLRISGFLQMDKKIKSLDGFNCQYLYQPRDSMVRVFAYVAKAGLAAHASQPTPSAPRSTKPDDNVAPPPHEAPRQVSSTLHTESLSLAQWQIDMLEALVKAPDMAKAKQLLNRYKTQNRIKRLGDRSTPNSRPHDSYFLIYADNGSPMALLAPSASEKHADMISGQSADLDQFNQCQYIWFQISR